MTSSRLLPYKISCGLPLVAILAVVVLPDSNAAGFARVLFWSVPTSFFLSGIVLWRGFVKFPETFRFPAFFVGAVAFLAGVVSALVVIAFEFLSP
jgi:hypothetical protein